MKFLIGTMFKVVGKNRVLYDKICLPKKLIGKIFTITNIREGTGEWNGQNIYSFDDDENHEWEIIEGVMSQVSWKDRYT
jgi:hypothetical protein